MGGGEAHKYRLSKAAWGVVFTSRRLQEKTFNMVRNLYMECGRTWPSPPTEPASPTSDPSPPSTPAEDDDASLLAELDKFHETPTGNMIQIRCVWSPPAIDPTTALAFEFGFEGRVPEDSATPPGHDSNPVDFDCMTFTEGSYLVPEDGALPPAGDQV